MWFLIATGRNAGKTVNRSLHLGNLQVCGLARRERS
jgi:hypothetical protein